MNLDQIIRKARFEVDALRTGNQTSALWSDEEMVDMANTAMDSAARIMRLADAEHLTKTIKSTDASINFPQETYAPTALKITAGQTLYTLPPDCVRPVQIVPIDEDYLDARFHPIKPNTAEWTTLRTDDTDAQPLEDESRTYHYHLVGERTLQILPEPQVTFDIEVLYQFRPARLQRYTTGTISVTNGNTAVTGSGTTWTTPGLTTPLELVVGSTSVVDINTVYPRVASIGGATSLTLALAYAGSTAASQSYILSMVPQLPEEHHSWLAQMVAALMLRKVSIEMSDQARQTLEKQLELEVKPEVTLRQLQESYAVPPFTPISG